MKKYFSQTLLKLLLFGIACNAPIKKDLPKEKQSVEHPNLIKTLGDPRYGNVQCILQDKAGNLWFGTTENGLYKYDGKSFRRFLVADGLNSNSINDILEDKEGRIWIGTKNGINIYDGFAVTEIRIQLPKNLPPNTNKLYQTHSVFDIMQDQGGKLWFVTIDGVYIYDGKFFTPFYLIRPQTAF